MGKVCHSLLNLGQQGANVLNVSAAEHGIAGSMLKENEQHLWSVVNRLNTSQSTTFVVY